MGGSERLSLRGAFSQNTVNVGIVRESELYTSRARLLPRVYPILCSIIITTFFVPAVQFSGPCSLEGTRARPHTTKGIDP